MTGLLALWMFAALSAHGAQQAIVEADSAMVYDSPRVGARPLVKMRRGTKVTASNLPTRGFYKVRTPGGKIGWVTEASLVLKGRPGRVDVPSHEEPSGWRAKTFEGQRPRLGIFGGLSLFDPQEVTALTGYGPLANGAYFGADFHYPVSQRFSLGIRFEGIRKDANAVDDVAKKEYSFSFSSVPLMVGTKAIVFHFGRVQLNWGLYLGLGIKTQFVSISKKDVLPNETVFSSSPLTFLGKLEVLFALSERFGMYAESGYRYLKTSALVANPAGNGKEIFFKGGKISTLELDYSGFQVGAGLSIGF